MKKMLLLGIAAVTLVSAAPVYAAHAGLSLNGETGIARTPMAVTLAPMTLGIAADYVFSDEVFVPARIEFGVIDGLEIGGKFWWTDTDAEIKVYGGNLKYVIPVQLVENLGIAVGGGYGATSFKEGDNVSDITVYGVATYTATVGGMAIVPSLGVSWDKLEKDDADFDENGVRVFGSLAVMVLENLAVAGELVSTNEDLDGEDADMSYWFGARFMPLEGLTVQAGVINNANMTNDGDPADAKFHVGAQYALSLGM